MLRVSPLKDTEKADFYTLFESYYRELGCDDDIPHLLDEYVMPDLLAGLIKVEILRDGEDTCGFVIYQTDDITNDWNFKEGWGDIREIYITKKKRGQGLGKFLLYTAEMKLKESGAERCYCLPNDGAIPFFLSCGYAETEEYNPDLDCPVFEKLDLSNCCKDH